MTNLFKYAKYLLMGNALLKAVKNLLPFILIFIFFPEINATLSRFPFYHTFQKTFSSIVSVSMGLREIPVMSQLIDGILWVLKMLKDRLISLLSLF